MKSAVIDTVLGPMLAKGVGDKLYSLEFGGGVEDGRCTAIDSMEKELGLYFEGKLKEFKTPLCFQGTPFQVRVWEELRRIPYGETRSYAEVAGLLGMPTAYRAVANANGANRFAIVVPCHRVISTGGGIGGYGSGLGKKRWLLDHEK